jgi:uncharacterized protein
MQVGQIDIPMDQIEAFCRRWKIRELSIFGSVLRPDFGPESDVDVLVSFERGHGLTFESHPQMLEELKRIFDGREVDLVEQRLVQNPFRRHHIMTHRRVLYAA